MCVRDRERDTHVLHIYTFVLAGSQVLVMSCSISTQLSSVSVHSNRLVMRPKAGGSAAEATREEVPCSRSDLSVINQTLRGEGRCASTARRGVHTAAYQLVSFLHLFSIEVSVKHKVPQLFTSSVIYATKINPVGMLLNSKFPVKMVNYYKAFCLLHLHPPTHHTHTFCWCH